MARTNHLVSVLAGTRAIPLPWSASLSSHFPASGPKGGLHHTKPRQRRSKPFSVHIVWAVFQGCPTEAQGSSWNGPRAAMISGGVSQSSDAPRWGRWWDVSVICPSHLRVLTMLTNELRVSRGAIVAPVTLTAEGFITTGVTHSTPPELGQRGSQGHEDGYLVTLASSHMDSAARLGAHGSWPL